MSAQAGSELESLYKNKAVVLWVEDQLTRTYLRALWGDTQIALLVAGGNEGVEGAVRDARRSGYRNVCGLRDRDFLVENVASWPNIDVEVLKPAIHEIENVLVRPDILAKLEPNLNPQARTALDLQNRTVKLLYESLWWMAYRAVLNDAWTEANVEFPKHPHWPDRRQMLDRSTTLPPLELALTAGPWRQHLDALCSGPGGPWVEGRLDHHAAIYKQAIQSGGWTTLWSGKDLFKELAGHVNVGKRKHEAAEELGRAIGLWQRAHEQTGELWDLHAILYQRLGLTAPAAPPLQSPHGTP